VTERREPHYDLDWVKARVAAGDRVVTKRVERYIRHKGFPAATPARCVAALEASDFHKSQQHLGRPDEWLDIYRPVIAGQRWYVKVALFEDGVRFIIMSCCRDGEAH
jgi:hypothetical protein